MDIRRVILFAALALVGYSIWTNWQKDFPSEAPIVTVSEKITSAKTPEGQLLPDMTTTSQENPEQPTVSHQTQLNNTLITPSKTIHIVTDVLDLLIDFLNGMYLGPARNLLPVVGFQSKVMLG